MGKKNQPVVRPRIEEIHRLIHQALQNGKKQSFTDIERITGLSHATIKRHIKIIFADQAESKIFWEIVGKNNIVWFEEEKK